MNTQHGTTKKRPDTTKQANTRPPHTTHSWRTVITITQTYHAAEAAKAHVEDHGKAKPATAS